MTTQVIRPAGASHETLYVALACLLIVLAASLVVAMHGEKQTSTTLQTYQIDARRDLTAGEQGIHADLRVTLEEIQLLSAEAPHLPTPEALADDGFAPFARDASSISRGNHQWQLVGDSAYVGLSEQVQTAGSFILRARDQGDVWLNRQPDARSPAAFDDASLIAAGWQQVVSQFDAGVTRQHSH